MSRCFYFSCLLLLSISTMAQPISKDVDRLTYTSPISWRPNTYVCQQPFDEIIIDGIGNENSWGSLVWSDDFVDIRGSLRPMPTHLTQMKMLWDEQYLYILAKLEEPHIWASLKMRDTIVYYDDAFEVFIDPDGDGHNYYEFQVNAFNTLWDLFMLWPYREKQGPNFLSEWDAKGIQHAVHIEGSLNDASDLDAHWTVEIAIPWKAIQEMAPRKSSPKNNDQWRMNFTRVDWSMKIINGAYEKILQDNGQPIPENYATWSPHGTPAMHMPEWWGYVQFSDSKADEPSPRFKAKLDEEIKWALWQLYYQQKEYHEKTGHYAMSIEHFTIPTVKNCSFEPTLFASNFGFHFSAPSCNGKRVWMINEMGLIDYEL